MTIEPSFGREIEYGNQALMLFSARERNMVLKAAGESSGEEWLIRYLEKRFDRNYMKRHPFNYKIRELSFKQKIRKAHFQGQRPGRGGRYNFDRLHPFIMTGRMHAVATSRSRVVARSPGGRVKVQIKIPIQHGAGRGGGLRREYADIFRQIPRREEAVLARHFANKITEWVNASSVKRTKSGRASRTGKRTIAGARSSIASRGMTGGF